MKIPDVCPRCRQHAPVVYRGVNAFCTACGAPRMPLSSNSVNLAGRSSKVGGVVTRTIGWIVLVAGLLLGFGTLGTCGAIVGFASAAPYLLGVPVITLALVVGWLLMRSGKELSAEGTRAQKTARTQAVFALANVRGGLLTALDVSQAMGTSVADADALLTSLAKEQPENVTLDIDDQGAVFYRFMAAQLRAVASAPQAGGYGGPRVDAGAEVDPANVEAEALAQQELDEEAARGRRRR